MHNHPDVSTPDTQSVIHRLSAGEKMLLAMLLVVFAIAVPRSAAFLLLPAGLFLVAIIAISRASALSILKRLLLVEPFVIGVSLLSLWGPDGWRGFLFLVAKSTLCVMTTLVLARTTPFSDMLQVLRRLRVPALMVTTLALMYRYLFVLSDEATRMRRANASRTFVRHKTQMWRRAAMIIGQLFVRSSERADRVYAAMCARGWQ